VHKQVPKKQRDYKSQVDKQRNIGYLKVHKSVLLELLNVWRLPLVKKTKRNLLTGNGIQMIANPSDIEDLELIANYKLVKHGWLSDRYSLASISISYSGIALLEATNPIINFMDMDIGGELIPNNLVHNCKYAEIGAILEQWNK
jgi:hypothetical protein